MTKKATNCGDANDVQEFFDFSTTLRPPRFEPVDFGFLRPLKPTVVFQTYWRFAVERQNIFFRRVRSDRAPWTRDPILQEHKFTNVYRASDRVSQYLIRNVIYDGDQSAQETFFRIILFKIFNRIETWELLKKHFGQITYAEYSFRHFDKVLTKAMDSGDKVYSAAYIMPSGGPNSKFARKHQMHLGLIEAMMNDSLPDRLTESKSLAAIFHGLKEFPTIGDFLAFQYAIDVNYSTLTNFNESEFVVAGPGAKDGIRKCFSDLGGLTESEVIRFVTDRQKECFATMGIEFPSLWGRPLKPIDCQNLFCEVDKYSRIAHPEFIGLTGRTRIKQKLSAAPSIAKPWYPPKWGLNNKLNSLPKNVPSF